MMMMHFYSREFLRISFSSKANSFCPLFAYTVSKRLPTTESSPEWEFTFSTGVHNLH